jgi:adenine-specific DNA-methyltransferase
VAWERIAASSKWSTIIRPGPATPAGHIEIGELFRVHRGQVTGSNDVWIAGDHTTRVPDRFLTPAVTKARDLLDVGDRLTDATRLRRVVDLPLDLEILDEDEKQAIEAFLDWAQTVGAHETYIAKHRKAWWSVGLRAPAPILCTYMARRPPLFSRNLCQARHINIAHGLYPRDGLDDDLLNLLVAWLNENASQRGGRTYAGGLTKFEPKEIERLSIPPLEYFRQ